MCKRTKCISLVSIAVVAIVGLQRLPQTSVGLCQECGTLSGVSCFNETAFSVCFAGIAENSTQQSCPLGLVCVDNAHICGDPLAGVQAECPSAVATTTPTPSAANRCNECSIDNRYGCDSATTFGLCFGAAVVPMDAVRFSCPAGMWCDVEAAEWTSVQGAFCTSDQTRISCNQQTTTTTATATTTANINETVAPSVTTTGMLQLSSTNVTELCSSYQITGRFAQPLDTTCKKYFFCYVHNNQFRAQTFDCVGLTYFSQRQQRCVSPYTNRCVNGTLVNLGQL